jgi:hypothetical protein
MNRCGDRRETIVNIEVQPGVFVGVVAIRIPCFDLPNVKERPTLVKRYQKALTRIVNPSC